MPNQLPEASAVVARRKLRRFIPFPLEASDHAQAAFGLEVGSFISVTCVLRLRRAGHRMKRMRTRSGRALRENRRVRMVTRSAVHPRERPQRAIPVTAHPAMHTQFPIAIGRPVTTGAELRALPDCQLAAILGQQFLAIQRVVAVETSVVAVVPPVMHDQIAVFLGQDDLTLGVQLQVDGFVQDRKSVV